MSVNFGYYLKGSQMGDTDPMTKTNFTGLSPSQLKWFANDNRVAEIYGSYKNGKGSIWIYQACQKTNLLNLSSEQPDRTKVIEIINNAKLIHEFLLKYILVVKNTLKIEVTSIGQFQNVLRVPFGFCPLDIQRKPTKEDNFVVTDDSAPGSGTLSNQRRSIHTFDKLLALYMMHCLGGNYHGYYATAFTKTEFHRDNFHSEVCLFETKGIIEPVGRYILAKKPSDPNYYRGFIKYNNVEPRKYNYTISGVTGVPRHISNPQAENPQIKKCYMISNPSSKIEQVLHQVYGHALIKVPEPPVEPPASPEPPTPMETDLNNGTMTDFKECNDKDYIHILQSSMNIDNIVDMTKFPQDMIIDDK